MQSCLEGGRWWWYVDFQNFLCHRGMYLLVTPHYCLASLIWQHRLGGCDLVIIMAQTWPVQRQWATGATQGPQSEESFTNCAGILFVCLLNWWEWSQFPTMMSLTLMTMIMTETEQWGGRGQMGTGTLYKLVNIIMASWHVSSLQYRTRLHRWSIVFQNGWSLQLQR